MKSAQQTSYNQISNLKEKEPMTAQLENAKFNLQGLAHTTMTFIGCTNNLASSMTLANGASLPRAN
jgi:hypothetical protein